MKRHAAPIIAAILLLLPVLYVGSYFALVTPGGSYMTEFGRYRELQWPQSYRWGGQRAAAIFWPLEKIDRKVRPGAWALENYRHSTGEWLSTYRPQATRVPIENSPHLISR